MPDLTPDRLARLRALAEDADPRGWIEHDDPEIAAGAYEGNGIWTIGWLSNAYTLGVNDDVRYVAGASPDVVLGLLDEIDRLRAIIEDVRAEGEPVMAGDEREVCPGAGQPAERAVERHPFGGVCSVCGQNVHTYDGDWVTGAGGTSRRPPTRPTDRPTRG